MTAQSSQEDLKHDVRSHWEAEPCGSRDLEQEDRRAFFAEHERLRYEFFEPYIPGFARFEEGRGKKVLEIGIGVGTDFINWARSGAELTGLDLTAEAIALGKERLALEGLEATLQQGDAESLPFDDATFDLVYSYGVLHHTPNTPKSLDEVFRVLKPGGTARLMLYNLVSWTSFNVWAFQCLAKGRPWKSPRWAVYHHLESPGTKAYTARETRALLSRFEILSMRTEFLGGDLLHMARSEKYSGRLAQLAFRCYPRPLIRALGPRFGFARLIEARKPA